MRNRPGVSYGSNLYGHRIEHTLQSNNVGGGMHNGRVSANGAADGRIGICHVDDNDLLLISRLFAHAYVFI